MALFTARRFFPLFATQFLGAFNDNFFKNALVMLVAFRMTHTALPVGVTINLSLALFVLPYFLFSATAGQFADKYDRARVARITKLWELIIVGVGAAGFLWHLDIFLLVVLFMLGVQATAFGPVKYALLPQHLADDELLAGNAMIEAGNFLAILLGTIAGGVLIMQPGGEAMIVAATAAIALAGYVSSRFIPPAPAPMPALAIDPNIFRATWNIVQHDRKNPRVFNCILAISWFWTVGAVFLSQFPVLVKDIIGGNEHVVTLFLTMFSFGIGIGSFAANLLTKGKIDSRYVAAASFGMALFTFDLAMATMGRTPAGDALSISAFIGDAANLRILADLLLISLCAGIFVVPLYAIMQHDSDVNFRARTIATCNVLNACGMVGSSLVCIALLTNGWSVPHIFGLMASGSLLVGLLARRIKKRA